MLKSRSMEAGALFYSALTYLMEGAVQSGWSILQQALEMSRDTGMGLDGPSILGAVALCTDRPEQRDAALEEGKRLLSKGSVSHNHVVFHRMAIAASLKCNNWEKARAFAADLEEYTRLEPIPWADLIIDCGRGLADFLQGARDRELLLRLEALHAKAMRAGYILAARDIEQALARALSANYQLRSIWKYRLLQRDNATEELIKEQPLPCRLAGWMTALGRTTMPANVSFLKSQHAASGRKQTIRGE